MEGREPPRVWRASPLSARLPAAVRQQQRERLRPPRALHAAARPCSSTAPASAPAERRESSAPTAPARAAMTGPPLLSSNLCCAWWALRTLGVRPSAFFARVAPALARATG